MHFFNTSALSNKAKLKPDRDFVGFQLNSIDSELPQQEQDSLAVHLDLVQRLRNTQNKRKWQLFKGRKDQNHVSYRVDYSSFDLDWMDSVLGD